MKNLTYVFFTVLVLAQAHAAERVFKYDEKSGTCVDAKGEKGLNKADPAKLFKDYNEAQRAYLNAEAECADLKGFEFQKYTGGMNSRKLVGWNVKGADMSGAKLHFVYFEKSDFKGANCKDMSWGYASLQGTIDKFTVLPENCASKDGSTIDCSQ